MILQISVDVILLPPEHIYKTAKQQQFSFPPIFPSSRISGSVDDSQTGINGRSWAEINSTDKDV